MKRIEDYLHLYFHNEIEITEVFIHVGYKLGQRFIPTGGEMHLAIRENPVFACKPILRPLSSMTEEETIEFKKLIPWIDFIKFDSGNRWKYIEHEGAGKHETRAVCTTTSMIGTIPMVAMPYLLSKGFDLFGLIDSGLALNKETLTP